MTKHLFGLVVTAHGTAANNRAESEGNITTLQKIIWRGEVHTTVSAEAIRFAIRWHWQRSRGEKVLNRVWKEGKDKPLHEWQDHSFRKWQNYLDDDVLGFMSAEAAKEETNVVEESGGKKGKKRGTILVRRSRLEVTRAISLTPFAGDITFNAASVGATPSASSTGKDPVPYGTEVHATRYQYGFALTPEFLEEKTRALDVVDAVVNLSDVAGNQARFLFDFSPDAIILRWTDDFAPRLSFFFNAHNDFFEEIAKYRAMRRLWAKLMKELGVQDPRSMWFRTSTQTAGSSLTTQQPFNNIVRATIESMAAILGGTQSLQPSSYDEGLALPTEESATMSLRIQQIIAYESGITNVTDPLAGSYFVEFLTNEMERKIKDLFDEIEAMGGMKAAVEKGWVENEIEKAMISEQRKIENKERILVGVNEFRAKEEPPITIHIPETKKWEEERRAYLSEYRKNRDKKRVAEALDRVKEAWGKGENMIPIIVEALKAKATHGEIQDAMREAQGFKTEWW